MRKIIIVLMSIFISWTISLQAQWLEFYTAKEGLTYATTTASNTLINPKLVNISAANVSYQYMGMTIVGEYKYSGDSIGMANFWLYTFSPDGDPYSFHQVLILKIMGTYTYIPMEYFDFSVYGISFEPGKYIDTATMIDSDEFTLALSENIWFDSCQNLLNDPMVFSAVGIAAMNGFDFLDNSKVHWLRILRTMDVEIGCKSDFDNVENLECGNTIILDEYSTSSVDIFPSPASNIVNISNPENEVINSISIYDVNGKMLFIPIDNYSSIDVSKLVTGNYFICFEIGNKKIFRSVIKN